MALARLRCKGLPSPVQAVRIISAGHINNSISYHSPFSKQLICKQTSMQFSSSPSAANSESLSFKVGQIIGEIKKSVTDKYGRELCAKHLYESSADGVNYIEFFKLCSMPDTFQSWFLVLQLHVWLTLVRLRLDGQDGKDLSYQMVEIMWQDLEARMKFLGVEDNATRRSSVKELGEEFFGLIIAYDEGLLGSDEILATALWRNMFHDKENSTPSDVAILVEYVRKQALHLEGLDSQELLLTGKVNWLPLNYSSD